MNGVNKIIINSVFISWILLTIVNAFDLRECFEIMVLYSLLSVYFVARLIIIELKNFNGINLKLPLLVGICLRLIIPSIDISFAALNGEKITFLRDYNDVTDYILPTVIWMNIYYMIFYFAIEKYCNKIRIEGIIQPILQKISVPKITIPLFVVGTLFNIAVSYVPAGLIPSFILLIFGKLSLLAIMAQMFDALFSNNRARRNLFIAFILVSICIAMFFSFYKTPIMMNIVYYMFYYYLDCKYQNRKLITPKLVALCASTVLIMDIIVYPFMTTKRIVAGWDPNEGGVATIPYSNWEVLKSVLEGKSLSEKGDNTASDRLNAIPANAFFYKECCLKGLRTSEVAINNIELLVPRFINPNKHNSEAGMMVYAYATTGSFKNIHLARSNNYIGQFGSAYLIGGWLLAIVLAFINGRFIIFYYNFLIKYSRNVLAVMFLIPVFLDSIQAFEEIHDGGFLRMGMSTAYMLMIYLTSKLFKIKSIGAIKN